MFNRPQNVPMPEMGPPMNQPFGMPNLAHPMNLPYPYPNPPQPAFPPGYPPNQQQPQPQPQPQQRPQEPHPEQMQIQPYPYPDFDQDDRRRPQPYPDFDDRDDRRRPRPPFPPSHIPMQDFGPRPYVIDIEEATIENNHFRRTLWTGDHLQVTLMSIEPREEIGLEIHRNNDQFIRVEQGQGVVLVGDSRRDMAMQSRIKADDAIMIPAGKWHNIINTGNRPLKLYSIYAPSHHPRNTIHRTKQEAMASERELGHDR